MEEAVVKKAEQVPMTVEEEVAVEALELLEPLEVLTLEAMAVTL